MEKLKNLIIAKSSDGGWLPLWIHHRDTAGIISKLLEHYISPSFSDSVHEDKEIVFKIAKFMAMVHDIGKATLFFQHKIISASENIYSIRDELKKNIRWYEPTKQNTSFKHALIGEVILDHYGCPDCISSVIGAHHGIPSSVSVESRSLSEEWKDIDDNTEIYGFKENIGVFNKIWEEIITEALEFSGFENIEQLPQNLCKSAQLLLSGLLIMADWIASNTDYFPLFTKPEIKNKNVCDERIEFGWENINLPDKWTPGRENYTDEEFKNSFGFLPNSIQKEILSVVKNSVTPGLYILEAPMGIGKTEAALASGEVLANKYNKCGLYFGMPTQATTNGLFPRIKEWGEKLSLDETHTIQLRHSASELNEEFRRIKEKIPDEHGDSGLLVHSWFCNSKKACLSDFVIGCVDQLLMMALKRKHVMLLHLGLSEKVVVVDECHAYDAYMNQYLCRALEWLGAYGVPVILLSATLPAEKRRDLIKAYTGEKDIPQKIAQSKAYPILTWTDGGNTHQRELPYDGAHKTVEISTSTIDDFGEQAKKILDGGGCVGIIVNTIKRAQKVLGMFKDYQTILYHAQFLIPDRNKKESEILERIGKKSTAAERSGLCIIGTQVLEQSLDVDFDLLITDIAPMDLLLQRIGRLHRHSRNNRPECAIRPTCIVLTDELENDKSGSKLIYTEWLLKTTRSFLSSQITLPDDISTLVQDVYGKIDEDDEAFAEYVNERGILCSNAKNFLLDKAKGKSIHGLLDREVSDIDAEAGVRCGMDSIEVLAFVFADGKYYFMNGKTIPDMPDEACYAEIARQKIRLPYIFASPWNIEKTLDKIKENKVDFWENSYLTADMPVLLFNAENKTELNGYELTYSYEFGLQYRKKED